MSSVKSLLIKFSSLGPSVSTCELVLELTYKVVEVEGAPNYTKQLHDMYDLIECRTVEHFALDVADNCTAHLWFDEEGKLDSSKENCFTVPLKDNSGKVFDVICGSCLVTRSNEEYDIDSITEEDIDKVLEYIRTTYDQCCGMTCNLVKSE